MGYSWIFNYHWNLYNIKLDNTKTRIRNMYGNFIC